ncbi:MULTISPECIES: hypothetical protein [Pseudomonas]|jgi:uncharacterized membrane protein YeiH|uniref:hypothetical protein n=1 Tax=Pseudomonas sp. BF-R-19 TaxID=2832397 RepID=UPI0021D87F82|nr:hypothetical protein [Pseudomonas sp. BF-R-19]
MVISFIVVLGGGMAWDLGFGATPPNAVADWRYPTLVSLASTALHPSSQKN